MSAYHNHLASNIPSRWRFVVLWLNRRMSRSESRWTLELKRRAGGKRFAVYARLRPGYVERQRASERAARAFRAQGARIALVAFERHGDRGEAIQAAQDGSGVRRWAS